MKFNYQARTKKGEIQSGVIEASSKEAAIFLLQRYGLYVTFLEEAERVPFYAKKIRLPGRISRKELVLFFRQLSIMFESKVTLLESLRTLSSQTKNVGFQEKLLEISDEIEGGTSFSSALSKYPQVFSSFQIAMIKSGEVSGTLSQALDYLADHLEREYHLLAQIKGAMLYPALILSVILAISLLMIFYIIPQLIAILEEVGGEVPFITQLAITFVKGGVVLILILVVSLVALFMSRKSQAGKESFDKIFLKIPLLGNFSKMIYLSRFAENLSSLISSGLPIAQCLEISGKIVGNSVYQEIIFQTRDEVRRGEPISSVLFRFPQTFPPLFTQMVLVGERSGTLNKVLTNLAGFYQKEIDRNVQNLVSVLEPLMIVFLGIVVGTIVVAFYVPLYGIIGGLH